MEVKDSPTTEPVVNAFGEEVKKEEVNVDAPVVEQKDDAKLTPSEKLAKMAEELGSFKAKVEASEALHKKKDDDIRARVEKVGGKHQEGGTEQEGDVPFKEIKTSKDLTEDERDEMTDAEIKAMDESATLKQTINQMARDLAEAKKGKQGDVDVNATVRTMAETLASNDADIANKIIEAYNGAKFNTTDMSAEEIEKSVELVAGLVTGYKAPAEGTMGAGKGKPASGGGKSDPYGVDAIVESVAQRKQSNNVFNL
jgi:hypothetical protein